MIIEKLVAKKNLASTLALALGIALPGGVFAQVIAGSAVSASAISAGSAASFAGAPIVFSAPALSLSGTLSAPSLALPVALSAPGAAMPAAAASGPENIARTAEIEAAKAASPASASMGSNDSGPENAARTAEIERAKTLQSTNRASMDGAFDGTAVRGELPIADLAEKASGYVSEQELPSSRVFLGAKAVMDNGRISDWRFSYSDHRGRADRITNHRTQVDVYVTPDGALITKAIARNKAGFFSSRKFDGLKAPETELKAVLASAASEYPDMVVEAARFTEETDSAEVSFGTWDPPETHAWGVPVWRLEGRSKTNPGVTMNVSYEAKTALLRDERTKIADPAARKPEDLPGNTPVWVNMWLSFKAPYPTAQRVIDAKRDRIVSTYGVQSWTELKTEPKMFGYMVYRMRMTAAQYVKLRQADTGAHFEYAESGDH
jgi:hypothetical protein